MYNKLDNEDAHDYAPNELAYLQTMNREKYNQIVGSNLEDGDTIEKWQQRNLERMQAHLRNRSDH